jgi:hypothetical protein
MPQSLTGPAGGPVFMTDPIAGMAKNNIRLIPRRVNPRGKM